MNTTISAENCVLVSCLAIGWAVLTITKDLLIPLAGLALTLAGWRSAPPPAAALPPATVIDIKAPVSCFSVADVKAVIPEQIQRRMAELARSQAAKCPPLNLRPKCP
ncbi:MAG: hypothetical protein ACK5R2_12980 [Cyanobacteriota bacterium]|jgi:hypothetical protein